MEVLRKKISSCSASSASDLNHVLEGLKVTSTAIRDFDQSASSNPLECDVSLLLEWVGDPGFEGSVLSTLVLCLGFLNEGKRLSLTKVNQFALREGPVIP